MQLNPGTELQNGKYRIVKTLGQGGFGITYLAEQTGLHRKVAIKEFFMKEYCERDDATSQVTLGTSRGSKDLVTRFRSKFVREAQMIAELEYPHIVKIHDVFEENGTAYYVMQFLAGESLSERVKSRGPLAEGEALEYIRQVGKALEYVHARKFLHFDVKPSNILVNESGEAILIDFGVSKHYDESGSQTSSTPVGISKGYAPMEQYQQNEISTFTPATDIYALGATLYTLLTGEIPPSASEVNEDGLPALPETISKPTREAIEKAMQPRRKDRPQSVPTFLSLLDEKTEPAPSPVDTKSSFSDETVFVEKESPTSAPKPEKNRLATNELKTESSGKTKKTVLFCSIILAIIVVLLGLFLFKERPIETVFGGSDAEHLHSFFFGSLCEPIKSLSQDDVMGNRLRNLLKKNQLDFIEENLSACSPVSLKYDNNGNTIFSFFGTKNADTNPETYSISYTDVGGNYGWFDVTTVIGGKRTQFKESVEPENKAKTTKSTIREWHYSGTMGKNNKARAVDFVLYVDGAGDIGDMVKGCYQEDGNSSTIPVSGIVKAYASSATLALSTPEYGNDFLFVLYPFATNDVNGITLDLKLCLDGYCESKDEEIKLLRNNMLDIDAIQYVTYEGRLFKDNNTYPIGMELAINSSDHENEIISGFYYYKSKGRNNFIPLNGYCAHGFSSSSIATLFLETIIGNETFLFESIGSLWGKAALRGGTWTCYEDFTDVVKNELEVELINKSL